MRFLAFLATLTALAATALAGQELWQVWRAPPPPADIRTAALPAAAVQRPDVVPTPQNWPLLFGSVVIEEPQPPEPPAAEPEPQPPAPSAPPLASLGYSLKGVVSDGANRWAIISHPAGEQLVRVGDPLAGDYTISAIDSAGLWVVAAPGADPQLLEFAK